MDIERRVYWDVTYFVCEGRSRLSDWLVRRRRYIEVLSKCTVGDAGVCARNDLTRIDCPLACRFCVLPRFAS